MAAAPVTSDVVAQPSLEVRLYRGAQVRSTGSCG